MDVLGTDEISARDFLDDVLVSFRGFLFSGQRMIWPGRRLSFVLMFVLNNLYEFTATLQEVEDNLSIQLYLSKVRSSRCRDRWTGR